MHPSREFPDAIRAVLLAFGLLVAGLLFRQLITLLIAILITVLIAIALSAAATRLERWRIPRPFGALIALVFGLGVLGGVLALVIPSLVDQTAQFVDQVPSIVASLEQKIGGIVHAKPGEIGDSIQRFLQRYTEDPSSLIRPIASIGLGIAGAIGALFVILLTAFYIAISPRPLLDGMTSLLPPDRRPWAESVFDRLRTAWIGWMQGVLIDMLVTGVLLYIFLSLIGLDFALVFAVFSAVLVVIPYFGAIAGGIPPVLFALTDSPGTAALALVIYIGIQQVESNLTIPLVMAQRVNLHPAVVAIGVIIVGQLFGFVGLFVAVPILSLVVILTDEVWVKPLEARRGLQRASQETLAARSDLVLPEHPGPAD